MGKCKFYGKCAMASPDSDSCTKEDGRYNGMKKAGCYHEMARRKKHG